MAYFGKIGCMNCEETLDAQLCSLFVTEEYVYDAIKGLVGITLNFDRHCCDATVYEAVLMPLVDIIECRERAVEILSGFVKPVNSNNIADSILSLLENEWISILKTYFQLSYFLPSDSEEEEEESENDGSNKSDDSEKSRAERRRIEREELKEMMRTFGENTWEVFRCAVQNGNMAPFRKVTNSETWWFAAGATANVISIGEFAGVIMQTLNGDH
ncbi:hypothetical protein SUGI_0744470 [Cryptomeria japonica]|nr:hypothetical protein SUGI_0744470 [Cryptomeria japonica]